MVTEVRELQPAKAYSPIVVAPSPIIIRLISDLLHGDLFIFPFPVMTKTPLSVRSHLRLGPQVPEFSALANKSMSRSINKVSICFILVLLYK